MTHPRQRSARKNNRNKNLPATISKPVIDIENKSPPQNMEGVAFHGEYYQGPLPHPDYLRQYEEMYPGAAKKMIDAGIRQTDHRINIETKAVNGQVLRGHMGVVFGFVLGLIGLIGGIYVMATVESSVAVVMGGVLSSSSLGSLVGVFIYGTRSQRSEREQKSKGNP